MLWFPPERTGTMIALAYSMGGLGAISASAPLEVALRHFDWRADLHRVRRRRRWRCASCLRSCVPEHPKARRPRRTRASGLRGLRRLVRDAAFWRVAVAIGTNQCAVVSLFTLWITTWLRDVAGYDRAGAAQRARLGGGRDDRGISLLRPAGRPRSPGAGARRCRSSPPAWSAASAASRSSPSASPARRVLALGGASCSAAPRRPLAHSIVTRRYPREMAGRVNTALNTFTLPGHLPRPVGRPASSWASGRRPRAGYDPRGYSCALGALWLVQPPAWRGSGPAAPCYSLKKMSR